eukprot:Phypoly_transcript_00718.p1 GENE.Phypoly_transcript_00718~~Phypoly_transcript_00718.p1  ORF type:complete len:1304 (+),score=248.57 Phypoly_transcript_00718:258-4169(+)
MLQKDKIGQDIILIGPPDPLRRYLAFRFCEISQRECEYISLSRDTVESDLKQRREMVDHSAKYIDQSAVRAAIEGRVLIIEGLERAERNILPIINNLLENREMALEDGRFLMNYNQYQTLLKHRTKKELDDQKIACTHPNFRVIALALPVPPFQGSPLDPPLRSRFQARYVNPARPALVAYATQTSLSPDVIEGVANFASILNHLRDDSASASLPSFPSSGISHFLKFHEKFPSASPHSVLKRVFPISLFGYERSLSAPIAKATDALQRSVLNFDPHKSEAVYKISQITPKSVILRHENSIVETPKVSDLEGEKLDFVSTERLEKVLTEMIMDHAVGRDLFLLGPKGSGKTVLVKKFASVLGYKIYPLLLYKDMAVRDLLQTRWTDEKGDTKWTMSNLVRAALDGGLALLDNVHRLPRSVLPFLSSLIENREVTLYDGKRLVPQEVFQTLCEERNMTGEQLSQTANIFPVHPNFRVVLVGETSDYTDEPTKSGAPAHFLTPEILPLFSFHEMPNLNSAEKVSIVSKLAGCDSSIAGVAVDFVEYLRNNSQMHSTLTLRQLVRACKKAAHQPHLLPQILRDAVLAQFLPPEIRDAVDRRLSKEKVPRSVKPNLEMFLQKREDELRAGLRARNADLHLVPNILFHDNPRHSEILQDMRVDFFLGEHLLLIGNQGVGKNKLADKFLQNLGYPRQYIQLHRDSTVPSLIARPTLTQSRVEYEDTPMIIAIKNGHVLVVDEADKAQLEVVCVLKGIVDGELALPDGRIIRNRPANFDQRKDQSDPNTIWIHPGFRMIVLANRPGFPFMGNDFYRECGDLFSCHGITPPSSESEVALLEKYAPSVKLGLIQKLVATFTALRVLVEKGVLSYPYSTREAVAIVRHLENFPNDSLEEAVLNVFSFDTHDPNAMTQVAREFQAHGLPLGKNFVEMSKGKVYKSGIRLDIEYAKKKDTTSPKHGKEDPKNEPHVGGNTWAGGTGGADTAGLGGKGGPYRLDAGHPVHQISDEEKALVDEKTKAAARKMGQEALKKKLEEIGMGKSQYDAYQSYLREVQADIAQLRVALNGLETKSGRGWVRMKTEGELDETRLVEGLTGETTIFKRRGDTLPSFNNESQNLPKRIQFVMDVSGSMYRFNGTDHRLERLLESTVLIMESFTGFENKIEYAMSGHSGDSHAIPLIPYKQPPTTMQERYKVLQTMSAHSQYCWSGDNTLEATEWAIEDIAKYEADERFVFVVSDANLSRYGITPEELAEVLTSNPSVKAYIIFIASRKGEAQWLLESLPPGMAFVCLETSQLPATFNRIFKSEIIK